MKQLIIVIWWLLIGQTLCFASGAREEPLRRQLCGRYSMAVIADYLGTQVGDRWPELLPQDRGPFSVTELTEAATAAGLKYAVVQWTDLRSADFDRPCILHIKSAESSSGPDHFVACFGTDGDAILIADFPQLPKWIRKSDLALRWHGTAIYLDNQEGNRLVSLAEYSIPPGLRKFLATIAVIVLLVCIVRQRGHRRGNTPSATPLQEG